MTPPPTKPPEADFSKKKIGPLGHLAGGGMKNLCKITLSFFFTGLACAVNATEFDHTHARYGDVLKKFVSAGRVNYSALKADRQTLDLYLNELSAVSEAEFNVWPQAQRLSFLINLYNAQTLALIIDHYSVKSIKDIGSIFKGPWDQPVVHLWGKTMTLNTLEHEILRKQYQEPRIHFALVCAALGCPSLREEPYQALQLERQLEDQTRKFLADQNKNKIDNDGKIIHLSPIFKWFEEDFSKKSGSVLSFVQPYLPEVSSDLSQYLIQYTDYDWSLNEV